MPETPPAPKDPADDERALDRDLEIRDPEPASPEAPVEDSTEEGEAGPYKNLIVPLVVVPALIVMVGLVIVVLFGLLSGEAKSPRQNLDRLLNGGANERQQAAFELVRQMLEYQTARAEGADSEWDIGEGLLEDLRRAADAQPEPRTPEEVWSPFVIASLMAQLGDPDGVTRLLGMTELGDRLDPEFQFGQNAIFVVGSIGGELAEPLRDRAAARMISLLDGEDEGAALLAAAALQNLPSPGTVEALEGVLGSRRLDLRIQAALSLVERGVDSGRPVLLEAAETGPYDAERGDYPRRWAPQTVSATRCKALVGLHRLGGADALLERLAREEDDPNVRSVALELSEKAAE